MPKYRTETDDQYYKRTIPFQYVSYIVSGSTDGSGILAFTHSLNVVPKNVQVTYYDAQPHNVNVKSVTNRTLELYFFDKNGAIATEAVTASLFMVTQ